jgi:hypothetical protein
MPKTLNPFVVNLESVQQETTFGAKISIYDYYFQHIIY